MPDREIHCDWTICKNNLEGKCYKATIHLKANPLKLYPQGGNFTCLEFEERPFLRKEVT